MTRTVYLSEELGRHGPYVEFLGDGSARLGVCGLEDEAIYLHPDYVDSLFRALLYRFDCDWPDCTRVGVWAFGDRHLCQHHQAEYRETLSVKEHLARP